MPVITISRMFGSGGSDVAERVARALGWSLLDNAFVDAVAERLGVPRDEISAREERVPSLAERLANAMALGSPEMMPPVPDTPLPPSEERIIEVTKRVVDEAVARGPIVMVGRGAQCMLAAREDALHVFCYAPRPALVARAMRRLHIDAGEAERVVDETNRNREQYVKKHWHRAWKAHDNYHLCVNTDWLGMEGTAEIVVRLARDKFGLPAT
jgi:cytidylate kinase